MSFIVKYIKKDDEIELITRGDESSNHQAFKNYFANIKTNGTIENYALKSLLGFFGGCIIAYFFFIVFVFQLDISPIVATIVCSILGVLLSIGLGFNEHVRCLVFLFMIQLCSKKGRQMLMAYALLLMLTGPTKNTIKNIGVLSESLTCSQKQFKEAANEIKNAIEQPFIALKESLEKLNETLQKNIQIIKEKIFGIKARIKHIVNVIESGLSWLGSIVNFCNQEFGTPFQRCIKMFASAASDCAEKLGSAFSWLCSLTHIADNICFDVKFLDNICELFDFIDHTIVEVAKKRLKEFEAKMRDMFYVSIKIQHRFNFETNSSKSTENITAEIMQDLKDQTENFLKYFSWINIGSVIFLLWLIIKVIFYHYNYMNKDNYDNNYITGMFREIDSNQSHMVLPLRTREENTYIMMTSFRLVKSEKIKMLGSLIILSIMTLKMLIHFMVDYSIYWILIQYHNVLEGQKLVMSLDVDWKIQIHGHGFLSDLYRNILDSFKWTGSFPAIDPADCLKIPTPPDMDTYLKIISIILACWIFAIIEPYGLRFRHVVMLYYHPERTRERTVWLIRDILDRRISFLKLISRKIKLESNNLSFLDYIRLHIPWMKRFIKKSESCLICGVKSQLNIRCTSAVQCNGIFCKSCFEDLHHKCPLCFIVFEDSCSELSEEKGMHDREWRHGDLKIHRLNKIRCVEPNEDSSSSSALNVVYQRRRPKVSKKIKTDFKLLLDSNDSNYGYDADVSSNEDIFNE